MGDSGSVAELAYEPLPYRDLWPVVEELLPPLSRHDTDHLAAVRSDALLDAPHLLLDVPGFASAGDLEVVDRDGTLDLTFAPPAEPAEVRDTRALYGSVGSEGDRMVLRFRLLDDAGQPISTSACKLCDGPVDLFRAHEHSVQGRFVLSGDCVVLEVGAVPQHAMHAPLPCDIPDVPVSLPDGFPSPSLPLSEPEARPLETTVPLWTQPKTELLNTPHVQPDIFLREPATSAGNGFPLALDPDDPPPVPVDASPTACNQLPTSENKLPYQCTMCSKAFSTRRVLNKHALIHSGVRHACDRCPKTFGRLDRLQRHQLTHSEQKQHACEVCGKSFFRREYLVQHQSVHSGEQPYQCDVCGMRFALTSNFARHKLVHSAEKKFPCDECGRGFNRLDHLQVHKQQHSGDMPLICDQCGLQCANRHRLERHMLVHAKEKMYGCAVCKRRFRRKDKLSQHMTQHADSGSGHACDLCPRVLARLDLLRQHARQHADPSKVQCPICFKFFIGQARYEAHAQSYHKQPSGPTAADTGQHACHHCLKMFRRPAALHAHLRKVHDQAAAGSASGMGSATSVHCQLCQRVFSRQQTLRAHVRRVHGDASKLAADPSDRGTVAGLELASEENSLDAACGDAASLTQSAYQMLSFSSYSF